MKQGIGILFLSLFVILLLINKTDSKRYNIRKLYGFRCRGTTRLRVAIRVNNKNQIECFSTDGRRCSGPFKSDNDCRRRVRQGIRRLRLVQCKGDQTSMKGHWCKRAHRYFFHRWHCKKQTGLRTGVKLDSNSGNAMCISFNGKDCLWGSMGNKVCKRVRWCKKTRKRLKPLICGPKHKKIWGHDGYRFPSGHWCKRAYAFFKYTGVWHGVKNTKVPTLLRMTRKGDVGCISPNKRDCVWNIKNKKFGENIVRSLKKRHRLKRLLCGNQHKRYHRSTGFETPRHWCNKAVRGFFYGKFNTLPGNGSGKGRGKRPRYLKNPKKSRRRGKRGKFKWNRWGRIIKNPWGKRRYKWNRFGRIINKS